MRPTTTPFASALNADELANGQTVQRANRVPRIPAQRPGLFRRLHIAIKRLYLEWLLHNLGEQLDDVEDQLNRTAAEAARSARAFRYSPLLNAQRRDLRRHYARIGERMLAVRRELDSLQAAS